MKKSSLSRVAGVESATQPRSSVAPGVGQPVHALVRAPVLRDRVVVHEPVALQARERRVDLAGVQRRQDGAEALLERLLELIPVSGAGREQRQERETHLDTRYTYRVSICQASLAVIVKVTSKPTSGLNYVGTDAVNDVRFTLTGTTITVDDIVPIQAGEGCAPVAGDATKVTCVAFKEFGDFKPLFVDVLKGADTVRNQTSGTGAGETGDRRRRRSGRRRPAPQRLQRPG